MLRKKILFAINHLGIGGAENMVIEQIRAIDSNVFNPILITLLANPKINLAYKITSDAAYVPFHFSGLFDIYSWLKLWKFFKKEKFDIVVTNLFMTNFIVRTIAIISGVPKIYSYEHSVYQDKKKWQITIDRVLAYFTKKIFVGSSEVLEFTADQERISKEKFCLNYNAIPLLLSGVKKDRELVLGEYNLPKNYMYIVAVGRLIEQKGHSYLIEAAKIMSDQGISNFQILIFGQGILESKLKDQIISLDIGSKVKLMGLDTMDKILAISDIFVLPSLWEGLSIALLQAMDSGSPIVATDVSGSREVIINGESGLMIDSRNSKKLASALSSLINDRQLRIKLARGATERVKMFSIQENVKIIEKEALS